MTDVYDAMRAAECFAADVCVMDPACPFAKAYPEIDIRISISFGAAEARDDDDG